MNDGKVSMKITVVTQAYNAKGYIPKCVESVLNQTYTNFEYILVDNGCQDGTQDILQEYAKQDERIKVKRFEKNIPSVIRWIDVVSEIGTGDYVADLDADDWYDPTFLERMVSIIKETDCDIAATGTAMHFEDTNQIGYRSTNRQMVIDKKDFANAYSYYHAFFRTVWAKLIRMELIRNTSVVSIEASGVVNGIDTLNSFAWLRNADRICVDNSVLHHYLFHKQSLTSVYHKQRAYEDIALFEDAVNFLSDYGPISPQNMSFVYLVYVNAIHDTHTYIGKSTLSYEEKLKEYHTILSHDVTKKAFALNTENTNKIKLALLSEVFNCASQLTNENDDFNEIKSIYFPVCGDAVSIQSVKLFLVRKDLFHSLMLDDRESIVRSILSMMQKQQMIKQFDLIGILNKFVQDKPLLNGMSDMKFFRRFGDIYLLVFQEKYDDALEIMTDFLLEQTQYNETFLQFYLSVSALLECEEAFIFGKVKLASFYCMQKQYEKCSLVLDDLKAMGIEDNEEISQIKSKLNI